MVLHDVQVNNHKFCDSQRQVWKVNRTQDENQKGMIVYGVASLCHLQDNMVTETRMCQNHKFRMTSKIRWIAQVKALTRFSKLRVELKFSVHFIRARRILPLLKITFQKILFNVFYQISLTNLMIINSKELIKIISIWKTKLKYFNTGIRNKF